MIYRDGAAIHIGDEVDLGQGQLGFIVGIIEERRYDSGYSSADWQGLGHGLLIKTSFGDLRMEQPDEDLCLLARRQQTAGLHG